MDSSRRLSERALLHQQAEGIAEAVSGVALAQLASKVDLKDAMSDVRQALSELKVDLLKFMFGAMAAQTALIVALIELLK